MDKLGKQTKDENAIIEVTRETVRNKIYTIRGQQVMLDFDLAEIYGYTTKNFNRQVKNNIEKFEGDFMFQLTKQELENLMCKKSTSSLVDISMDNIDLGNLECKNCTSSRQGNTLDTGIVTVSSRCNFCTLNGGEFEENVDDDSSRSQNVTLKVKQGRGQNIKYLPHAFTEQGIYMLMTVLKGDLAVQQSIALIRLFKGMKDYIAENQGQIGTPTLAQLTAQNTIDIAEIKSTMATKQDFAALQSGLDKVMENFIDPDSYKHFLILDGQKIEAEAAYNKIYASAKQTVYVIDNYIGLKTLEMLRTVKKNVKITIFSDNLGAQKLTKSTYDAFCKEYPNINIALKQTNGKFHDRYIVLDAGTAKETIYHCGASAKDAGGRITTIMKVEDNAVYKTMLQSLGKSSVLLLK